MRRTVHLARAHPASANAVRTHAHAQGDANATGKEGGSVGRGTHACRYGACVRALFVRYLQCADLMLCEVVAGGALGPQALQAGQRDVDHVLEELALAQRRLAASIARHRARRGSHRGHTTRTRECATGGAPHALGLENRDRGRRRGGWVSDDAPPVCEVKSHRLCFR